MKNRFSLNFRSFFFKFILYLSIFLFLVLGGYAIYLATQIEHRFSGRKWNIPSKVFSDKMLIYPGQQIDPKTLSERLARLGYDLSNTSTLNTGEYRFSKSEFDVFLKDMALPDFTRTGFPVRIVFQDHYIIYIESQIEKKSLPYLEIEPEEIMLFFGAERERRHLVSIKDIPDSLKYAVLSAEDRRFYSHFGVDPAGLLRALYKNLKYQTIRQGGSTLTQQLAKNYFLTPERTISRKLKELLISFIMEGLYEKDEILEIYLNEIYLGQNGSVAINGVGEAALFYFGKEVRSLRPHESAVIAGLIKAPNAYSPYINIEKCKNRRDMILNLMFQNGYISEDILNVSLNKDVTPAGYRTYARKAPYFIDYLSRQLKELYPEDVLNSEGLAIYTTLDMQVQLAAEKALKNGLKRLEDGIPPLRRDDPLKKLQGAVIVMQPRTGNVLAMVGGRDYSVSQFNRATDAFRQPGSAFKPFVFFSSLDLLHVATMLENKSLSTQVDDEVWTPKNFSDDSPPRVSMRDALAKSYNIATVDLALKTGLDKIITDIETFQFSTPLKRYPSLALGAYEVKPMELARAYCVFPSDGVLPSPLSIKKVINDQGEPIERRHMDIATITTPGKSYLMNSLLQSVVSYGTAKSLKNYGIRYPVCGKTGTTNNSKDAWFVGYTPDILVLVWVGFDNSDTIYSTGSSAALPIWADLMNHIPEYVSGKKFQLPEDIVKIKICPESGKLFNKNTCTESKEEVFLRENIPSEKCRQHTSQNSIERFINNLKHRLF